MLPTLSPPDGGLKGLKLRPGRILPSDPSYYHYFGSLTTPPCSEVVNWVVMKQPLRVTKKQVTRTSDAPDHHRLLDYRRLTHSLSPPPLPIHAPPLKQGEGSRSRPVFGRYSLCAWLESAPSLHSGFA